MTFVQFAIYAVISAPLIALAVVCFLIEVNHVQNWGREWADVGFLVGLLSVGCLLLECVAGIWWFQP